MIKKVKLSDYLASAPVQENLKNFAGLDAQNALGLMTPERLAAVAGGLQYKGRAPLDDNIIPETGFYLNTEDRYYPAMYGLLLVFKTATITHEIFISCAQHFIKTRRHEGTYWNTWG